MNSFRAPSKLFTRKINQRVENIYENMSGEEGAVLPLSESKLKSEGRLLGIFFGWWTVLASNLMTTLGQSIPAYGYGVFLKPIAEEFGWSRAVIAGAASVGRIEGGIEGPFGGMATDKYGPRIVSFIGNFIAGLGLIMMSRVNSLLSYYLFWLLTSIGFNLGLGGPLYAAVSQWFVKKRGLALSITKIGFSVGGSIMPLIMTFLLFIYGWRKMFIIIGLFEWAILLPLSWFFIKPHRPEHYGVLPDGEEVTNLGSDTIDLLKAGEDYAKEVGEVEYTASQAYRTKSFWLTVAAFAIRGMVTGTVNMHTIPLLTDMGMDSVAAAAGLGLLVGISLPGRLIAGILCDKIGIERIRYLLVAGFIGIFVSFFILLNAGTNITMLYAYLIIYGVLGLAFPASIYPIIFGRYFGRKAYSTIDGTRAFITGITGLIAPIYAGWVYDVTGSYRSAFQTLFILTIGAIVVAFFAKPPKAHNTANTGRNNQGTLDLDNNTSNLIA